MPVWPSGLRRVGEVGMTSLSYPSGPDRISMREFKSHPVYPGGLYAHIQFAIERKGDQLDHDLFRFEMARCFRGAGMGWPERIEESRF
jgi:hypothetical protein